MEFDTSAVLSTSTGKLMGDIGGVYAVVSYLIGRDAFTHELAFYGRQAAAALIAAVPDLPSQEDAAHVNGDNWRRCLSGWEVRFGPTIDLPDSLRDCLADDRSAMSTAREMLPHAQIVPVGQT